MKICIIDKKIYIKEDQYTNSIFKLDNRELKILKTINNNEYYKKIWNNSERTYSNFLKYQEKTEKKRQYYSEEDLLKQENEKKLYYLYNCLRKQQNAIVNKNTFTQAKRINAIILLLILIKNKKIKLRLQEIIEKKENIKINFEEIIKLEFKNIKLYNTNAKELLIGELKTNKLTIISNSKLLLRNYTENKIQEIEYYKLFFNNTKSNEIWKLYKLLISKINIVRHDTVHCFIGIFLLIYLLQNKDFYQMITEIKKKTKYKSDKEILEKYKDLLYI